MKEFVNAVSIILIKSLAINRYFKLLSNNEMTLELLVFNSFKYISVLTTTFDFLYL